MSHQKVLSVKSFLVGTTTGVVVASLAILLFFFPKQEQQGEREISHSQIPQSSESSSLSNTNNNAEIVRSDQSSRTDKKVTESLDSLINDDVADVGQLLELLQVTSKMWSEQGISALQQVFDSIEDGSVRESVVGAILHQATTDGYEEVFTNALNLKGDARRWILHEIVTAWSQSDPRATVAAVWALPSTDPSIRMLQRRTVWEWAEIEPRKMLANMDEVPENIRNFAQEKALLALARTDPEAVIGYLLDFSGSSREATLAHEIAEHWATHDPDEAFIWTQAQEFSTSELRRAVLETTLRSYARVNPQGAFETARKHPRSMGRSGVETIVIAEIAKSDTTAAVNLLSEVRNEAHTIFNAYLNIAQAMVQFHLEFDQALELGEQVPLPQWHEQFFRQLSIHWAAHQPLELLDRLDAVPSDYRSYAAYCIIATNSVSLVLDTDQIQRAHSFLNAEDFARVSKLPSHYVNTIQFPTHDKAAYSPAELAELSAKSSAAKREVKLRRQGLLDKQ
ncbi:MAG: hypothetical protein F4X56_09790 [Gammaproteobacteria bacterium]|nr:hypothetical protein [Gammaproteobacteria bacterium]